jgi:hypothetical protein
MCRIRERGTGARTGSEFADVREHVPVGSEHSAPSFSVRVSKQPQELQIEHVVEILL